MAIYLKKFENHTQYETYTASTEFITPNVSLCVNENEVHYNPWVDPCKQYDYVEIGGVKWATKNVGACDITDIGLYFEWGNPQGYTADQIGCEEGKKCFDASYWSDYKWTDDYGETFTKYNSTDGKTVLEASDDAVTAAWGGGWRMPTTAEFQALGNAVNTAWTQVDGVYGILCTDKTDSTKTLFFPAAGDCYNGSVDNVGSKGFYLSSSLHSSDVKKAYYVYFDDGGVYWQLNSNRCYGETVRGVLAEN